MLCVKTPTISRWKSVSSNFSLWFSLRSYQPPAAFLSSCLVIVAWSADGAAAVNSYFVCAYVCVTSTWRLCAIMISVSMKKRKLSRNDFMSQTQAHTAVYFLKLQLYYTSYCITLSLLLDYIGLLATGLRAWNYLTPLPKNRYLFLIPYFFCKILPFMSFVLIQTVTDEL